MSRIFVSDLVEAKVILRELPDWVTLRDGGFETPCWRVPYWSKGLRPDVKIARQGSDELVSVPLGRLVLLALTGYVPVFACHHCDRPWCVRPDHLYSGDARSNLQDIRVRTKRRGRGFEALVRRYGVDGELTVARWNELRRLGVIR